MYIVVNDCGKIVGRGVRDYLAIMSAADIRIEKVEKCLRYYLHLPAYYKDNKRLISSTGLDVPLKRAIEYANIIKILDILEYKMYALDTRSIYNVR